MWQNHVLALIGVPFKVLIHLSFKRSDSFQSKVIVINLLIFLITGIYQVIERWKNIFGWANTHNQ